MSQGKFCLPGKIHSFFFENRQGEIESKEGVRRERNKWERKGVGMKEEN